MRHWRCYLQTPYSNFRRANGNVLSSATAADLPGRLAVTVVGFTWKTGSAADRWLAAPMPKLTVGRIVCQRPTDLSRPPDFFSLKLIAQFAFEQGPTGLVIFSKFRDPDFQRSARMRMSAHAPMTTGGNTMKHRQTTFGLLAAWATYALAGCILLSAQPNRITRRASDTGRLTLRGNVHPKAQPQFDRGPADADLRLDSVTVALKLSTAQQTELDQLLADQHDPASPRYHQWLTPAEYADRFGVSQADIQTIVDWLVAKGFTLREVSPTRTYVSFAGSASQVRAAFETEIHLYDVGGQRHFANTTDPSIPQAFAEVVSGVRGLHDFRPEPPRRSNVAVKAIPQKPGSRPEFYTGPGSPNYLAPADVARIYGVAPLYQQGIDGTGQHLAIIGQTPVYREDIDAFRSAFGLPPIRLALHPKDNLDYPLLPLDLGEADLDIEWASAVAPNATIDYVYAGNVYDALEDAINKNIAPVISVSYGFGRCEAQFASEDLESLRNLIKLGNSFGITIIAASGDSGAAGCENHNDQPHLATTGPAVSLPASVPEVTAVGGTRLYSNPTEVAWNDSFQYNNGFASSGGGRSAYNKPDWQRELTPNDGRRNVPDVAFAASGYSNPYFIITSDPDSNQYGIMTGTGGTSASAPVFAGVVVLINHYLLASHKLAQAGLGNINPALYLLAQSSPAAFHDITLGNNLVPCQLGVMPADVCVNTGYGYGVYGYSAGPGYDMVTGLGSVDASQLAAAWAARLAPAALPRLVVTRLTSDTSVALGSKINLSVTIKNQGNADAGAFRLSAILISSSGTSQSLASCSYTKLLAGQTSTCSGAVSLPAGIRPGVYTLQAVADSLNQVTQSDRTGNVRNSDSGPVTIHQ